MRVSAATSESMGIVATRMPAKALEQYGDPNLY